MNNETKKWGGVIGEIIGIIVAFVLLIYVGPLFPFITQEYSLWLPIALGTTVITSLFNIIKRLFTMPTSFAFEALSVIPGMYSTAKLIEIFPLDFGLIGFSFMNTVVLYGLYFVMIVLGFSFIISGVKFVTFSKGEKSTAMS